MLSCELFSTSFIVKLIFTLWLNELLTACLLPYTGFTFNILLLTGSSQLVEMLWKLYQLNTEVSDSKMQVMQRENLSRETKSFYDCCPLSEIGY